MKKNYLQILNEKYFKEIGYEYRTSKATRTAVGEKNLPLEKTKTRVQEKTKQIKKRFSIHNLLSKKSFKRT